MTRRTLLIVSCGAFALAGCGPSLDDARLAWLRARPKAYVFEYQRNCTCPGSGAWWRITVRGDSVVGAQLLDSLHADRRLGSSRRNHPTVTQMFDGIALFDQQPHTWTKVRYDAQWHYPSRASGDETDRNDAHWMFVIRKFTPITSQEAP